MKVINSALWALSFFAAVGLSWLIPPMQSPDEINHIKRAYLISKGRPFLKTPPPDLLSEARENLESTALMKRALEHGGPIGGLVDQGLSKFTVLNFVLVQNYDKRLSDSEKKQISEIRWSGTEEYHLLPGAGYYFPLIYAPQALGLAIGQFLSLSVQHSYYLARGLTLFVCFVLLWMAHRLLTPNPLAVAILLLPMSMFQMLSPTIDGLTTALAVLTISLFITSTNPGHNQAKASSLALAFCVFLLATSRTHLIPFLAFPFYLAWMRKSRRDLYVGFVVSLATFGWVIFAMYSANDPRIVRDHTTLQILSYYSINPKAFLEVIFSSLSDPVLFTFYQESFLGILGWLDTKLPLYFYPTLWIGLAACALVGLTLNTLHSDWRPRLLMILVALASVCLIFLALLVTWTSHSASVVQGVQGRYFVVPMILMGYSLSGCASNQGRFRLWLARFVLTGFAMTALTALTMTLVNRYTSASIL